MDHLDGVLLVDHLDEKTRKKAMKTLRERLLDTGSMKAPKLDDDLSDLGRSPRSSSGGLALP